MRNIVQYLNDNNLCCTQMETFWSPKKKINNQRKHQYKKRNNLVNLQNQLKYHKQTDRNIKVATFRGKCTQSITDTMFFIYVDLLEF